MTETMTSVDGNHAGTASRIRSARSRWWKKAGEWIKPPLIALAGLLGVLGILLTVLPVFGWNTVVLSSGSMSPSFPAGSILLAHDVPATQARVGDVVMVNRQGMPPVTHRVIAVEDGIAGTSTLRLQGDANEAADPQPYTLERVGLVAGGIPWGGQVLTAIRSPWALGALTIGVAALVLWSWWPKQQHQQGVGEHAQDS
jgi:signal peptidase